MIPDISHCGLLVIDMQEKLLDAMQPEIAETMLKNHEILLQLAKDLRWTVFYTEQYPKGLGSTHPRLKTWLGKARRIEKMCFSCMGESDFCEQVVPDFPRSLIVTGMETHICVLNTILDTVADESLDGTEIFVPCDAVCSRKKLHWKNALHQLNNAGVYVTNTESIVFQCLEEAGTDLFKKYSKLVK